MLQIRGGLERLRIVGRQRQRQRQRVARVVEAIEVQQRDGAIVVRLDGARRLARGLLGAGERALVVGAVEHLGGAIEQAATGASTQLGASGKQRRSGRGGGSAVALLFARRAGGSVAWLARDRRGSCAPSGAPDGGADAATFATAHTADRRATQRSRPRSP